MEIVPRQAATLIDVSRMTINRLIARGHIPAYRRGCDHTWWIKLEDFLEYARQAKYPIDENLVPHLQKSKRHRKA